MVRLVECDCLVDFEYTKRKKVMLGAFRRDAISTILGALAEEAQHHEAQT